MKYDFDNAMLTLDHIDQCTEVNIKSWVDDNISMILLNDRVIQRRYITGELDVEIHVVCGDYLVGIYYLSSDCLAIQSVGYEKALSEFVSDEAQVEDNTDDQSEDSADDQTDEDQSEGSADDQTDEAQSEDSADDQTNEDQSEGSADDQTDEDQSEGSADDQTNEDQSEDNTDDQSEDFLKNSFDLIINSRHIRVNDFILSDLKSAVGILYDEAKLNLSAGDIFSDQELEEYRYKKFIYECVLDAISHVDLYPWAEKPLDPLFIHELPF